MKSLVQIIHDIKKSLANLSIAMTTEMCNKEYVDQKIAELVNSAPEQLDTLQELSKALNNDKDFATTVNNLLAQKLDKSGGTITGDLTINGALNAKATAAVQADKATEADSIAYNNVTDKPALIKVENWDESTGTLTIGNA